MTDDYDDSNIRVLEGLEAVRVRPGMYIGSTGAKGLHHLVYEVVDNSIEEALAGHCHNIDISMNADGSITVADDGRGIESERVIQTGKFSIETIFTTLYFVKYRDCDYRIGGAFYGAGLAVVSALSSQLEVRVWRDRKIYTQRFEKGLAVSELEITPSEDERTGTTITFLPDSEIFKESIEFDYTTLAGRLRELAYLNAGIRISFIDYHLHAEPTLENYYYKDGIREYVSYINADKQALHDEIIYIKGDKNNVRVEVGLQWCTDDEERILGFANIIRTIEGGKHLDGLKKAITRTVNKIASQQNKLQSDDVNLGGKYIRKGLTAIISLLLPNPEWAGPTRTMLDSKVLGIVDTIVSEVLSEYFVSHPDIADAIINRAIQASDTAERHRAERELKRKARLETIPSPSEERRKK
jgi:DNA gyrase subunit B